MATQFVFDIGGTFTDMVSLDTASGELHVKKILTTPLDPTQAVDDGYAVLAQPLGNRAVDQVVHATTLATNALIERRGAKTALVTTKGFRDVLELAYEQRWDTYDLGIEFARPLVDRTLRFELEERMSADGSVRIALTDSALDQLCGQLARSGAESVAVCLLHSYRNPDHETAVRSAIAARLPDLAVSLSSDVMPTIREYERTATVAANAYVLPLMSRYLKRLTERLGARGYKRPIYIMLSNGGVVDITTAARYPVRLIESGPAAGAIAAAAHARSMGESRLLLAFDMGGTTAKVCVIDDGNPRTGTELEVARAARFRPGSGIPIKIPSIELIEIGAGGGSMATLGNMGMMSVGPESAGAEPGPVCYRRGNTCPTVTDADLVLGFIGADSFLGGTMPLDHAGASAAIREKLALPLKVEVLDAALGVFDMVNENMAAAARIHAVERGIDTRQCTLFAFGGAGPVHAYYVAKKIGVRQLVVPPGAGILSAIGLLLAPVGMDFVRSTVGALDATDLGFVEELYAAMTAEAEEAMKAAGVSIAAIRYARTADMRYIGQGHEVSVPLPPSFAADSAAEIRRRFEETYRRIYGLSNPNLRVEVLSWRLVASDRAIPRVSDVIPPFVPTVVQTTRSRMCYFPGHGATQTPVLAHYALAPGASGTGPAIIEQPESTTVIGPGGSYEVDSEMRLRIRVED